MLIHLTKKDAHESALMGADTVKLCEMQGFPPRLENDKQSRVEANIYGFKAEFAVARLLGLDPPVVNVLTDGGVDLWFDDVSIDVKLTNKENGPLVFDNIDKFQADCAVLVAKTSHPAKMKVLGFVTKKLFELQSYSHDFGYGQRLVMNAESMKPIEKLWKKMMERRFLREEG